MQPSTWNQRPSSAANAARALQIVDGAGVDGACRSDHAGRLKTCRAIFRDCRAQCGKVNAQLIVGADTPERAVPEAERLHRLAVAAVDLVGTIETQGLLDRSDALLAHVDTSLGVPRHGQADDIGHRAAADQRAAGRGWQAQHLLAPVDDLLIHQSGGMVAAAKVRALNGRQKIAQARR